MDVNKIKLDNIEKIYKLCLNGWLPSSIAMRDIGNIVNASTFNQGVLIVGDKQINLGYRYIEKAY
ncbi:hypothetical protein ACFVUU_19515 [Bacillus thuringiensis]|uniref:hypothetical protein n=1 Tax=Bacillus thuringiensis TaxID=1428 RepID=UPI0036E3E759